MCLKWPTFFQDYNVCIIRSKCVDISLQFLFYRSTFLYTNGRMMLYVSSFTSDFTLNVEFYFKSILADDLFCTFKQVFCFYKARSLMYSLES